MTIRRVQPADVEAWRRLRLLLWPGEEGPDEDEDAQSYLSSDTRAAFVAEVEGRVIGFLDANIRDYADGCETRNVGYIEGWYVEAEFRRQGVGARLVREAEAWARERGCREMASDCFEDNDVSLAAHLALGYEEKERLIHFGKRL